MNLEVKWSKKIFLSSEFPGSSKAGCAADHVLALFPFQYWNLLAHDGSIWQDVDLFEFQRDVQVSGHSSAVSGMHL